MVALMDALKVETRVALMDALRAVTMAKKRVGERAVQRDFLWVAMRVVMMVVCLVASMVS